MLSFILWAVVALILLSWLFGFAVAQVGPMIHLLAIPAIGLIAFNLLRGRSRPSRGRI